MKKIEIRWLERRTDIEETGVKSFIKTLDEPELNSMSAVEKVFKEWLEKKVKGRKVIASDVEIYVDGKLYPMEKTEENALYRRIGDAAGQ